MEKKTSGKIVAMTDVSDDFVGVAGRALFDRIPEKEVEKEGHYQREFPNTGKEFYAEKYVTQEMKELLKTSRMFDIHHFVADDHIAQLPKLGNRAKLRSKNETLEKRPLLEMTKTP